LAAIVAAALLWFLDGQQARLALVGLFAAWGAATISTAFLIVKRTDTFRNFLRAFGGGMFVRALVLVALMAAFWGQPWDVQAPVLATYALGVLFMSLVEYRQVARKD
jgi:uncharacterized membrane protein